MQQLLRRQCSRVVRVSCLLERISPTLSGKGYIDASTVSTAASAQIAEEVQRTGARFLEAPVSGSKQPAETGTLIFLTAGQLPAPPLSLCSGVRLEGYNTHLRKVHASQPLVSCQSFSTHECFLCRCNRAPSSPLVVRVPSISLQSMLLYLLAPDVLSLL